jgi:signal transduction histidine kinase
VTKDAHRLVNARNRRVSQLEQAKEAQEAFSRQLIASQESERKRIAAELHDSLGQHLLIIKNWAMLALRELSGGCSSKEALTEISTAASQAIDEVRAIAYNLRPYQLEKLGLTTAIHDLVNQVASSCAIRFITEVDRVDGFFSKDAELHIYRIVQEGLNNTVRHSQATEACVLVTQKAGGVKLTIQDNGRGFIPADGPSEPGRNGFGLLGIAQRARMLGGQVTIQSAPGTGTTVSISLKSQESS